MKKVFASVLVIGFLFILFIPTSAGGQKLVTITCPGGGAPVIAPLIVRICPEDTVTFGVVTAGADGCVSGVNVNGVPPIGNFNLTPAAPQKQITFLNPGTYEYTVTKLKGEILAQGKVIVLTEEECPTLTEWGIIILIALLVGSTVFIMLRRRKASVPA